MNSRKLSVVFLSATHNQPFIESAFNRVKTSQRADMYNIRPTQFGVINLPVGHALVVSVELPPNEGAIKLLTHLLELEVERFNEDTQIDLGEPKIIDDPQNRVYDHPNGVDWALSQPDI